MRILQINRNLSLGGAASVGYQLHNYINTRTESKSYIYCRIKNTNDKYVRQFYKGLFGKISCITIDKIEKMIGLQYFFQRNFNYIANDEYFKCADVVHFHITHGGYINQWFLAEVAKCKPVVWTFHDMWAITGRCAHSFDCERWKIGCGNCPYRRTYPSTFLDTSSRLYKLKKSLYSDVNINIVCPSFWLYNKLPESLLSHCKRYVIRNAVDVSIFRPYDKYNAREQLGLPLKQSIVLFVAHHGVSSVFKGFNYLVKALSSIYRGGMKPFLIIIGNKKDVNFQKIGLAGKAIGIISDQSLMAKYYSSVDALIVPSIAENVPLVIIESLSCGTPVIAFKVGGIPETIEHKGTGYLATVEDSLDLAKGIQWLMSRDNEEKKTISQLCRNTVLKEHSLDHQVKKYTELYSNIIN